MKFLLEPIVNREGKVWGYEVLFRGSHIPNSVLFSSTNPELEWFLFEKEVEIAKEFPDKYITLNLSPYTLFLKEREIKKFLNRYENIFIELTEKMDGGIELTAFVDLRTRLILDDFLSGSSGMERLEKLNPFAVKVPKSYTCYLNLNFINSLIIVEKIETKKDFEEIKECGDLFQGYFFYDKAVELEI